MDAPTTVVVAVVVDVLLLENFGFSPPVQSWLVLAPPLNTNWGGGYPRFLAIYYVSNLLVPQPANLVIAALFTSEF